MILVKNTPFSIKGEAFSHLNPAACFLAAHLNHFHISKPKRCFISMTSTATDQWSPNCFDSTFLPGMSEHAPPKCLLIYLWTRYMYFWSTHIFFLPTYKTVHPTSETTVTHEGKKRHPNAAFREGFILLMLEKGQFCTTLVSILICVLLATFTDT